jgi:hypothetical protein
LLQMPLCILWISSKRLSQNVSIFNFVHRFVQFIQWRWNTFNLSLPIGLFYAHKSLCFSFCLFPIFHQNIPSMLSVVDCLRAMSFAAYASFKLKDLNYDNFHTENVRCILTTFNGDVLFEFPLVVSPNGHSRQMQKMDKKHDGHLWCKVKMTNIKNDSKIIFWRTRCLGHLQCWNDGCDFFLPNKCRNETTWISDVIHNLQGGHFATILQNL